LDLDDVSGEVVGEPGVVCLFDQSFAVEEAQGQFLVVARCAHTHNERRVINADLQGLFDGYLVALAIAQDRGDHSCRGGFAAAVGHSVLVESRLGLMCWKPKRPLMQRLPRVMSWSSGELTLTIWLSWTCRVRLQPTPQ
jgi:hypothetical protein